MIVTYKKIPIEEVEDYGYVYCRNQPCFITQIDKVVAFNKGEKSKGQDKVKYDIVAVNPFTRELVFKGIIKGPEVQVPEITLLEYEVTFVSSDGKDITVVDENFEEVDGIELPVDDNPDLVTNIRKAVLDDEKDIEVLVVDCDGTKYIREFREVADN